MNNPFQPPEPVSSHQDQWFIQCQQNVEATSYQVANIFADEGYRLETGSPVDGMYGIGNNVLRIIFGAFIKRFRFHVTVSPIAGGSIVRIEKGMSGAMGGAIGYSKMKKELQRIRELVEYSL